MTPEVRAAILSIAPNYDAWSPGARKHVEANIAKEHPKGERAFVRSCAIYRDRNGRTHEVGRNEAAPRGVHIGTRCLYVTPQGDVITSDDWG